MNSMTVGLFGTCGSSRWRDQFMPIFDKHAIPYFNPQVAEGTWEPEQAQAEAWHLANDALVLFPITDETLAMASLAETGYSSHANWTGTRFVVIYVAPDVNAALYAENKAAADGSRRTRKLVREHLTKVTNPNVFVVDSLEEMRNTALKLWGVLQLLRATHHPREYRWEEAVYSAAWRELPKSPTPSETPALG